MPNDRDVTYIDDLRDTASPGIGRLEANSARLAGPHVGAFWKPGDPALISLPGPARLGAGKPALVDRQNPALATGPVRLARFRCGLEKMLSLTGTEGSNPSPSSGESATNHGRGPGDVSKAQPAFAAVAVDVVQFSNPLDRVAAGRNRGCDPDEPVHSSGIPALRSPAEYVVSNKARIFGTPQGSAPRNRAMLE